MNTNHHLCKDLRNLPLNKISRFKYNKLCDNCKNNTTVCNTCFHKSKLFDRFFDANIPLDLIDKDIQKDFTGYQKVIEEYNYFKSNIDTLYDEGYHLFIIGSHGVGKTFFATSLLKVAAAKGYNCLYINMADLINIIINSPYETKFAANQELSSLDFLVIDEFSIRMINENSAQLYGKILETLLRNRYQNKLSTICVSNNPKPEESLGLDFKSSLESLFSQYVTKFSVIGKDFRKGNK